MERELGWWRRYVFSTDHKVIGIQYAISGFVFLFFGFSLMMMMRWQLAYPGRPLPIIGKLFGSSMPGGVMTPEFYNSLGAMHGTIMVFLGIIPIAFAGFGNYIVPLQIGAPDMAFPKVNMFSYWAFVLGSVTLLGSFFLPMGTAASGWSSYTPLADIEQLGHGHSILTGQSFWEIGMVFLATSSVLGAINFITTIVQLRARGMTWMRLPFFVWTQFVAAFLLLLAFPPMEAGTVMQLLDRVAGTSFFLPSGLVVNGQKIVVAGGGAPLLWQHLFWFLIHPEVYVLVLPAMGIVAEIVTNNARRPLWSYRAMVFSAFGIGFLSFIVWAHHMYLTGMGEAVSSFFQTTTILISIPSVIILSDLFLSLRRGSIRFPAPMLFATAFMPMFGIGGLTGIPLALAPADLYLHDTYYLIAHFHYLVAPGTIFALFAATYYWFPKATGRMMNEFWGKVHFWPTLILMNVIFLPMFLQGMLGMHRRWYDGGQGWSLAGEKVWGVSGFGWNVPISTAAWLMGLAQIPFIVNFLWSIKHGRKVTSDNPWDATTLEWATPTPPPHGNFIEPITVYRGPYDYSVRGAERDFCPQTEAVAAH
ncbi:MAG TPA: cbb3-type cytochrome c oxidase subunit I [Chthoniobacterales bacterium]|jgi:cytochrome c oxidase subunit 1|nr:cbb3-type cytochrome c oxidase subunit I [Chthoniobacterales bacterium]